MTPAQERALEELDRDGHTTAEEVVDAARPEDHILHDLFEWRNELAAESYRLDQARGYLHRLRLRYVRNLIEYRVPVYVRDPDASPKEQGYVRTKLLLNDEDKAMAALRNEIDAVSSRIARARAIAYALGLAVECERMLAELVNQPSRKKGKRTA